VPITAPLRTQEIMLFYLATLLRTLAIDTYKVTKALCLLSCRAVRLVIASMNFTAILRSPYLHLS
jgi:hypothetical protein